MTTRRLALIILDGFGYAAPAAAHNAIAAAHMPVWNALWQRAPHLLIEGSGKYVGLPEQQMGNSEVGHLTIGAGRIIYQELTRIDHAIADGSFARHPLLQSTFTALRASERALHVIGLVSPGGVHSHENHIQAVLHIAQQAGIKNIFLHAFLDGRDTPPQSAQTSLEKIQAFAGIRIASLSGRYYAMDRDQRWQRTQRAYDLLTAGKADFTAPTAVAGLQQAYARGETDEFVAPTLITPPGQSPVVIENGDVVIFMNFRADRARQLTRAFMDKDFTAFPRTRWPQSSAFITLTAYSSALPTSVLFAPQTLKNSLGEIIAQQGLAQIRIAETEKYAHVTYFFNGGCETPFTGETRVLIPSPAVATYDLQPEMSAPAVTTAINKAIASERYTLLVANFANADMVGHTGNFDATVKAIETLDNCLGQILAVAQKHDTDILITADHGNAEYMYDEQTQQPHTAHTSNPVPLLYIGQQPIQGKENNGCLADIAPTILHLLGLPQPAEMTGKNLLVTVHDPSEGK